MRKVGYAFLTLILAAVPAFGAVTVSNPTNGATVSPNVQFVANATTTCSRGVASIGIYVDNSLEFVTDGTALNKTLSLSGGWHKTFVQEWDYCGGSSKTERDIDVTSGSGVYVSTPANGATVSSPVGIVANATTACAKGVAATGVYVNNQRVNVTPGAQLNVQVPMGAGTNYAVVQEWDNCGGSTKTALQLNVTGGTTVTSNATAPESIPGNATTLTALQGWGGWNQWGELAPTYGICSTCTQVKWSMTQHESAVSRSGNGTAFWVGGTQPYSDALFSNPFMGQGSAKIPDSSHTLMPTLHNFVYDTWFYVPNVAVAQSLEFDINMYLNGVGMEWGTQCDHLGSGQWDIWNNVQAKWVPTGNACQMNNGWNHVILQVQRESNNDLLYKTISLNGVTYNINTTVAPFPVPAGWYGMTVNYQMDGNHSQSAYTTYLDDFNVTYW
jgi:hypothetical protein